MFDKKLCMDNIYAIAKDKGIKIGELERTAGLSAGYLSKLSKEGNTAVPGIDSLLLIAQTLGVSIDALVSVDYRDLNSDEKYLAAFIEKLISGTELKKITWEIEGAAFLNTNDTGGNFDHPLFLPTPSVIEDPASGELVDYVANVYQSRFLRFNDVNSFDNCYHCEFGKGGDKLYMMKLNLGDKNYPKDEAEFDDSRYKYVSHEEVELYIIDAHAKVNPLCSTFSVGKEMKKLIEKLYAAVYGGGRFIGMSSETKRAIDRFMDLQW